eukprot:UN26633
MHIHPEKFEIFGRFDTYFNPYTIYNWKMEKVVTKCLLPFDNRLYFFEDQN